MVDIKGASGITTLPSFNLFTGVGGFHRSRQGGTQLPDYCRQTWGETPREEKLKHNKGREVEL